MFRKIIITLTIMCSALSNASYYIEDTHGLINKEAALKFGIEDKEQFIKLAHDNFDLLIDKKIVNYDRCKLFKMFSYVDFIDYLIGYWDEDYTTLTPGTLRAENEEIADKEIKDAWDKLAVLVEVANKNGFVGDPDFIFEVKLIKRVFIKFENVHNCSPELRITLPEKIQYCNKLISL